MRAALACIGIVLLLSGCKATNIKPFEAGDSLAANSEGEKRLWFQAKKLDGHFQKGKQVYEAPKLRAYLQGIMDKLYPEFSGKIRVDLHRAPVLNAFALPNGSIYINIGLLAALENEAQIASVLAHEGIHFLQKHSAKQRIYRHNSQGWAVAVTMMGIPLAGQLVAQSAMSGYSVEHETEADMLGYERLINAGYAASEAPRAFEILAREAKANEIDEPYFFASHPQLKVRIENFNKLNAENPEASKGRIGFDDYQRHVSALRGPVIQQKIASGKQAAVIAALEDQDADRLYPEFKDYYLALAFLKQEANENTDKAVSLLMKTIEQKPNFADAHRELGFLYLKQDERNKARLHLSSFIELAPEGQDTAFAKYYLDKLQ